MWTESHHTQKEWGKGISRNGGTVCHISYFHYIVYALHVGDIHSASPLSLYLLQRLQRDVCLETIKMLIWLSRASVDSEHRPILISYTFGKYKGIRLKSSSEKMVKNLEDFMHKF